MYQWDKWWVVFFGGNTVAELVFFIYILNVFYTIMLKLKKRIFPGCSISPLLLNFNPIDVFVVCVYGLIPRSYQQWLPIIAIDRVPK